MTKQEVLDKGYLYYCVACSKVYKMLPTEQYEDGHGGRQLSMCRCGCDLFANLHDDSRVV